MGAINEIKGGNKYAFNNLVENYRHIYYKIARLYLRDETVIISVIERFLHYTFQNIVEVKTERDFIIWSTKKLIEDVLIEKRKYDRDFIKREKTKSLDAGISSGSSLTLNTSSKDKDEYSLYREASLVESAITSIKEEYRLSALLYFYADFDIQMISEILNLPTSKVEDNINNSRLTLYEIVREKEADIYGF